VERRYGVADLYVLDRGRNWVVLTPGGYFAGTPAGKRLLRWKRARRLRPMSELRRRFNRPDLVRRALTARQSRNQKEASGKAKSCWPAQKLRVSSTWGSTLMRMSVETAQAAATGSRSGEAVRPRGLTRATISQSECGRTGPTPTPRRHPQAEPTLPLADERASRPSRALLPSGG